MPSISDCARIRSCRVRRRCLTAVKLKFGDRQQKVAFFDAVDAFDVLCTAGEPGIRLSEFSAKEKVEPEPEAAARRCLAIACFHIKVVKSLEYLLTLEVMT